MGDPLVENAMKSPRMLLVSQSFWPLAGESAMLATAVAEELLDQDCRVSVLTDQVVRQWPSQFDLDGIQVHRLAPGTRLVWPSKKSTRRNDGWHRSVLKWITCNESEFDFVIALDGNFATPHGLRHLSKISLPFLARLDQASITPWTESASIDSNSFRNVVASDQRYLTQLVDLGVDNLQVIEDGMPNRFARMTKDEARQSLVMTHEIFELSGSGLLAVNTEPIDDVEAFENLIVQWRTIAASMPGSKLWLLGSGSAERALFQRIRDYDIDDSIIMPGQFESIDVVLQAADLIVVEKKETDFSTDLKMAVEIGLPVICRDSARAAEFFDHKVTGLISSAQGIRESRSTSLAKLIIECCRDSQIAGKLADAANARYAGRFTMANMVRQYLEVVRRIVAVN